MATPFVFSKKLDFAGSRMICGFGSELGPDAGVSFQFALAGFASTILAVDQSTEVSGGSSAAAVRLRFRF